MFLLGLFVGGTAGIIVMGLMVATAREVHMDVVAREMDAKGIEGETKPKTWVVYTNEGERE